MLTLNVTAREATGSKKLQTLRQEGVMPAVVYGRKEETAAVQLAGRDFKRVFKEAGESTVITLKGLKKDLQVIVHDVDFDPVTDEPRHADFYAIEADQTVTVMVPIEFVGVAPAVKEMGGILVKVMHEIEVEALPQDLPHEIAVDISSLVDFDTSLHVREITFPKGVTPTADPEEIVASANPAVEEDLSATAEGPDMEAIGSSSEKGKKEEESAEDN